MRHMTTILATIGLLALPGRLEAQDPALVGQGAGVWANNCVRCHNARPSTERTDAQWAVIVSHMRARANLTRVQARTVTAFLQATNLPEGGRATSNAEPTEAESVEPSAAESGRGGPGTRLLASDGEPSIDRRVLERLITYVTWLRRP